MRAVQTQLAAVLGGAALAFSAATFSGCDKAGELQSAKTITLISERSPVFLQLSNGSLLGVIEKDGNPYFFMNAPGYGESGQGVNLYVLQGGRDSTSSGLYREIGQLEALAHVKNDWRVIYDAVERQAQQRSDSVNPQLVEQALRPLVEPRITRDAAGTMIFTRTTPGRTLEMVESGRQFSHSRGDYEFFFPVCVRLSDGGMLAVCELAEAMELEGGARWLLNSQTHIRFYRNWPSYGVEGREFSVMGVGVSQEYPVLGVMYEITPEEVLGYFNGSWQELYEVVRRQYFIVTATPHPDAVKNALLGGPLHQGTSSSLPAPEPPAEW